MLRKIFKPKWQHTDPSIRQAAVNKLHDQEVLFRLASEDAHLDVKKAAATKLQDLNHLLILYRDSDLQSIAQKRVRDILLDRTHHIHYSPALGSYLLETADPAIIQHLLAHNNDPKLQKIAIECSQDPETLYKTCVESSSSETRYIAASKLQDESSIRKALKELGKRDKRAVQKLRENLDRITKKRNTSITIDNLIEALNRLGQDHQWQHDLARYEKLRHQWDSEYQSQATEIQIQHWQEISSEVEQRLAGKKQAYESTRPTLDHMQSLCEITASFTSNLTKRSYIRHAEARDLNHTLDSFENEWAALPEITTTESTEFKTIFQKNIKQCRDEIQALIQNARDSKPLEALITKAEKLLAQQIVPANSVDKLAKEWQNKSLPKNKTLAENLQTDYSALMGRLEKQLDQQAQSREQTLQKIDQQLHTLEQAITLDQTKKASQVFNQINNELGKIPECPRDRQRTIEKTLSGYRPRIRELEGWRHWGTDRAREELIAEAKELSSNKAIAIEARANAIKDLRQRWKKLGKIDPKSGQKLWQQFDASCTEAYQPVKHHQKKEAEHRKVNLEKRVGICEELELIDSDTDWHAPEWREIDKRINKLRASWRKAGPVNRQEWSRINDRFNQAMKILDEQLENERRISHNRRLGLIEKVEQMRDHEDLAAALQAAREAQKAWNPTVTGKRQEEQKLWKQFRDALDAIYDRDKDRREHDADVNRSLLQKKQSINEKLERLCQLDGNELIAAHSEQQKLLHEWESLDDNGRRGDKKTERAFHQSLKLFDEHYAAQQLLQKKNNIIQQLQGDCPAEATETTDDLNTLIIELEIILEIDSPETDSEARMQLQVERLADAMSSRHESDEFDEIIALAKRVCQCRHRDSDMENLGARIEQICDRLVTS